MPGVWKRRRAIVTGGSSGATMSCLDSSTDFPRPARLAPGGEVGRLRWLHRQTKTPAITAGAWIKQDRPSRRVGAFLSAGLEQEPGAAFGLVDEQFEQTGGTGILVVVG